MQSDSDGYITLKSGEVEYRWIERDNRNPSIVLLHEGLGCLSAWKSFPQCLAEKTNSSVLVYSRFGYGHSSDTKLPRSTDYMHREAESLEELIQYMGFESVLLVGHSDGASIATIYAGSAPRPELVGLVQIAPHYFVEEVTINAIEKIRTVYSETELRERLMTYHGARVDDVFWGWNDIWLKDDFRTWNICDYLNSVTVPIQILQCEDDEYGSVEQIETAKQHAPGKVTSKLYSGCGHHPFKRWENEVVLDIARFMQ